MGKLFLVNDMLSVIVPIPGPLLTLTFVIVITPCIVVPTGNVGFDTICPYLVDSEKFIVDKS